MLFHRSVARICGWAGPCIAPTSMSTGEKNLAKGRIYWRRVDGAQPSAKKLAQHLNSVNKSKGRKLKSEGRGEAQVD